MFFPLKLVDLSCALFSRLQQIKTNWRENSRVQEVVSRLSKPCLDFLDHVFDLNEKRRMSIHDIKAHPWFQTMLKPKYEEALSKLLVQQDNVEGKVRQGAFKVSVPVLQSLICHHSSSRWLRAFLSTPEVQVADFMCLIWSTNINHYLHLRLQLELLNVCLQSRQRDEALKDMVALAAKIGSVSDPLIRIKLNVLQSSYSFPDLTDPSIK